ncbi:DMT family transporter [Cognatishimia maritima]|uniref:Threonine/homoserine efflux transporter RhtA n=1 Tax=Cognatishimia maritima TaxID=870908 RepID=A0A1M5KR92_9RHOB|nr:DMT family transporter [Cognatishimia maritima]SHG54683.1 Threonine/homoserine efflux transporter RhtA [Cognatishimia maritima]
MHLFLLTVLTMIAFAANSVLNRMAIVDGDMDAVAFAVVRVLAGAVMLAVVVLVRRQSFDFTVLRRPVGVVALLVYLFGFSFAYLELPSGVGALLLFGMVQITMFAAALRDRDAIPALRWAGTAIAFLGLCWMLWPQPDAKTPVVAMAAMLLAGVGWGVYSLVGKRAGDPTQATAINFILAAPVAALSLLVWPVEWSGVSASGVWLAIASGAVTSGLGYSLWYAIVPRLGSTRAAVAQLTVPVIATLGGALWLSEVVTLQLAIATALVLGGVALAMLRA